MDGGQVRLRWPDEARAGRAPRRGLLLRALLFCGEVLLGRVYCRHCLRPMRDTGRASYNYDAGGMAWCGRLWRCPECHDTVMRAEAYARELDIWSRC